MKTVYVLRSVRDPEQWYVGITEELTARLVAHNAGQSSHTAKFKPWKLFVSINFENHRKAEEFERYLKTGSGRAFAAKHFRT